MPLNFLSLARVGFFFLIHLFYLMTAPSTATSALYVVSAAFLVTTSAMTVGWIPIPRGWKTHLFAVELIWCAALNLAVGLLDPGGPMMAVFSVLFVSVFMALEPKWWRAGTIITTAAWLLSAIPEWWNEIGLYIFLNIAVFGSFHLFAGAVGALVRNLQDEKERSEQLLREVESSQAALQRAHRQLQESAARQQEMAVLEERQRLAREIHDSVAHGLTTLVVQIQAARRLMERSPEQATDSLVRCEEMARQALLETRQAVRALHPAGLGQASELEALIRLGRDFGAATGIQVTISADEAVKALPPDPQRVEQLYRIFQEAMTNAHRHGDAKAVRGELRRTPEGLEMLIRNDGAPPLSMEPGVGLRSMAERAKSLGGSIRYEPEEHGLTIRVTVPINQEAVS